MLGRGIRQSVHPALPEILQVDLQGSEEPPRLVIFRHGKPLYFYCGIDYS